MSLSLQEVVIMKKASRAIVLALFGVVCVGFLITSSASAGPFAKTTYLKFSAPVALPGAVLRPGEYVFELADPTTSRQVVRVQDRQRSHTSVQLLTRKVERTRPTNASFVTLGEAPAGAPRPITTWYPAGDVIGYEFIY
jgi:hypothetical protein